MRDLGVRRYGEQFVHGTTLVGFDVTECDPSQAVHRQDSLDGVLHRRKHGAMPRVEQQRFVVVEQELVERESARSDLGNEGTQPVDVRGDLVHLGRHHLAPLGRKRLGAGLRRAPVVWQWSRNMATDSSMRRIHRSPPGSLETCWSTRPVVNAVHMSTCRCSLIPLRARSSRAPAKAFTAGAYDSDDGSNPGSVRWNSSWYRARSLVQKSTNRRTTASRASPGSSQSWG